MIILPDTNVILRYLLDDNPDQYKFAEEFFEKVRTGNEKAFVLESVIVECVYILTKFYKIPKAECSEKLSMLLRYKGIVNRDSADIVKALKIFAENNLDIVDCVLQAKSKNKNYGLFSFDKKLKNMK